MIEASTRVNWSECWLIQTYHINITSKGLQRHSSDSLSMPILITYIRRRILQKLFCISLYINTYIYISYLPIYIIYIYILASSVYTYIQMYICICIYICVCIYTYIYKCHTVIFFRLFRIFQGLLQTVCSNNPFNKEYIIRIMTR